MFSQQRTIHLRADPKLDPKRASKLETFILVGSGGSDIVIITMDKDNKDTFSIQILLQSTSSVIFPFKIFPANPKRQIDLEMAANTIT